VIAVFIVLGFRQLAAHWAARRVAPVAQAVAESVAIDAGEPAPSDVTVTPHVQPGV
jgi:hypothetical protein